jgi:hypothetical protein
MATYVVELAVLTNSTALTVYVWIIYFGEYKTNRVFKNDTSEIPTKSRHFLISRYQNFDLHYTS